MSRQGSLSFSKSAQADRVLLVDSSGSDVSGALANINNIVIPNGLVPKGSWDENVKYEIGDLVEYNETSYIMYVDAPIGTLPTDTSKWMVVGIKGNSGGTINSASFVDDDIVFVLDDGSTVTLVDAKNILKGEKGDSGDSGDSIELRVTSTDIEWKLTQETNWNKLIALSELKGDKGESGENGDNVELRVHDEKIQWKLSEALDWIDLIALSELKGEKGEDGDEIELRTDSGYIQWKLTEETVWNNLISLNDLKGDSGEEVSLQKSSTHIQWRLGDGDWQDLVSLNDLKGDDGVGIDNIALHQTVDKVKTYRITFTDGSTFDFDVTDGADGSGSDDIEYSNTYFVSKEGSDENDGNTVNKPFLTIGKALEDAVVGTCIKILDNGFYAENLVIGERIFIDGATAILRGTITVSSCSIITLNMITATATNQTMIKNVGCTGRTIINVNRINAMGGPTDNFTAVKVIQNLSTEGSLILNAKYIETSKEGNFIYSVDTGGESEITAPYQGWTNTGTLGSGTASNVWVNSTLGALTQFGNIDDPPTYGQDLESFDEKSLTYTFSGSGTGVATHIEFELHAGWIVNRSPTKFKVFGWNDNKSEAVELLHISSAPTWVEGPNRFALGTNTTAYKNYTLLVLESANDSPHFRSTFARISLINSNEEVGGNIEFNVERLVLGEDSKGILAKSDTCDYNGFIIEVSDSVRGVEPEPKEEEIVFGDASDSMVRFRSDTDPDRVEIFGLTDVNLHIGQRTNNGNKLFNVGVMVFELPEIPLGKEIDEINLRIAHAGRDGITHINYDVDLIGVRYNESNTVLTDDYDASGTLLQESIINPDTTPPVYIESNNTGTTNLTNWIKGLYDNGAKAGDYVFIKLQFSEEPDDLNNINSYRILSGNNEEDDYKPQLKFEYDKAEEVPVEGKATFVEMDNGEVSVVGSKAEVNSLYDVSGGKLFWNILNYEGNEEVSGGKVLKNIKQEDVLFLDQTTPQTVENGKPIFEEGISSPEIKTDTTTPTDLKITTGADKTMELQTPVWDDMIVDIGRIRTGSSYPAWVAYKGSEVLSFAHNQDNQIFFTIQFAHRIKSNSTTEFHLHVVAPNNNAGVVRWKLTVSYASIDGTFGDEVITEINQTIEADSQDKHLVFTLANPFTSNTNISGFALCSLTRLGNHDDDTYNSGIYLIGLDSHYQVDTLGSRQITNK